MRTLLFTAVASSALLLASPALRAQTAPAHPATHPAKPADADHTTALPVTRVSLYKNGVGFFEHTGHVTGNSNVTIDFTTAQLNDVLQSLTAIDLNGGRISGAGYNSTTPLDQQLKSLPLALGGSPTVTSFYASLRGSRVEIRNGASSITGRLLSVETGDTVPVTGQAAAPAGTEKLLLTVVSENGDVRTVAVTTTTSVRMLDTALDADITRYLKLLDANRSQGLRHLTLEDRGTGSRELRVSYISEVPIWKATYRILFTTTTRQEVPSATLQGWSVVDNTTGTDWVNVRLSLIAGAPQSFIQPLSRPIYSARPEIPIAQEAQLTPQTFDSAMTSGQAGSGLSGSVIDGSGAVVPNTIVIATNTITGARETRTTDQQGRFSMPLPAGTYSVEANASGFNRLVESNVTVNGQQYASVNLPLQVGAASETVSVTAESSQLNTSSASLGTAVAGSIRNGYLSPRAKVPSSPVVATPPPAPPISYEDAVAGSFTASTQNSSFDDFFAYSPSDPITIRKNESALVPILQAKVQAEPVTLVSCNGPRISQPLRALWLTNNSGLTLDRGSFSIVEDGNFGGEGLLDPIHPNEKRLLSYAADQAVHVSQDNTSSTSRVDRITASRGVVVIHRAEHTASTYLIHNAAPETRTVVLETSIANGYTLDPGNKPEETTAGAYRFRLTAPAGQTVRLPIAASHNGSTSYALTNSDDQQLAFILQQGNNDERLARAIQPVLEARKHLADSDAAVEATQTELNNLHGNEDRQRANITALQSADKAARERFIRDLNQTEDQIVATQKALDARTATLEAAKTALETLIDALQLDESF